MHAPGLPLVIFFRDQSHTHDLLISTGFMPSAGNGNSTGIRINYLDENDHTAVITAEIADNTVKNIELEDNKEFPVWLLPLILAALIGTLLYKKYTTREIAYDQIVVTEPQNL